MCRDLLEGGRRCPGCGSVSSLKAHNERRVANREMKREVVAEALEAGVDERVVETLKSSPPSVARRWSDQQAVLGAGDPGVDELSPSPFAQRYDSMEEKLEAFRAELEERILALKDDQHWQGYLQTMSKFHHYSMANQLLIQAQRPDASVVAGFNRWKEMGRHVVKGERAITIYAPRTVNEIVEDAAGNPVIGEDGKPRRATRVIGFTTASVFDVSQTEGEPLPSPHAEISEQPPAGFKEDLESAVRSSGYEVEYSDQIRADGLTNPETKKVIISSKLSPAMQASTLAHELGHIKAGHLDRGAEYHTGHGGQRGPMEIEAESIAYSVCRANGMSKRLGDASGTYISGWARAAGDAAVKESAQKVSSVVKDILGTEVWRNMRTVQVQANKAARATRRKKPAARSGGKKT